MKTRLTLRIEGKVQGVGFRAFVLEYAEFYGVAGCAQNCSDGSVFIVAEGEPKALKQFQKDISAGPPGTRVEKISILWQDSKEEFTSFSIH